MCLLAQGTCLLSVSGGILTESSATWRAIFFIQAGLGFFFVILGWMVLAKEQTVPLYTKGIDWGGAVLSTAGFGLMTYSLAYAFLCPTVIFPFANQFKTGIQPRHAEVGPPPKFRAYCLYHLCFSHFSYIMSTGERPETSPF